MKEARTALISASVLLINHPSAGTAEIQMDRLPGILDALSEDQSALAPVAVAARLLISATGDRGRNKARTMLRVELCRYFADRSDRAYLAMMGGAA